MPNLSLKEELLLEDVEHYKGDAVHVYEDEHKAALKLAEMGLIRYHVSDRKAEIVNVRHGV